MLTRGWATYYRHTSLARDVEDIGRYAWFRYRYWLRKKHPGSRPGRLMRTKTKTIYGRRRWIATIKEGPHTRQEHQWLPTQQELQRQRYMRKGPADYPHPYLPARPRDRPPADYPQKETGPDERIYTLTIGATDSRSSRQELLTMAELRVRTKLRDGFACQRCGQRSQLHVHHRKGTKTHRIETLETVCASCHIAEHQQRQQE